MNTALEMSATLAGTGTDYFSYVFFNLNMEFLENTRN
jgi:hypothetical protein